MIFPSKTSIHSVFSQDLPRVSHDFMIKIHDFPRLSVETSGLWPPGLHRFVANALEQGSCGSGTGTNEKSSVDSLGTCCASKKSVCEESGESLCLVLVWMLMDVYGVFQPFPVLQWFRILQCFIHSKSMGMTQEPMKIGCRAM